MTYISSSKANQFNDGLIKLHDNSEFNEMRLAGNIAAKTLDYIIPHVVPGVTTEYLDQLCYNFIMYLNEL